MKFWDASALVALLIVESASRRLRKLADTDPEMLVWWGSEIECVSALARLERDASLGGEALALAFARLGELAAGWHEVEPSDMVRGTAARLLRVHPLRAADAQQLAAAFVASDGHPAGLELVTLDDRLAGAARKEGFVVLGVAAR